MLCEIDQEERLLTAKDIQYILGMRKNKTYELLNSKGFPTLRIGKRIYVKRSKLNEWINLYSGRAYLF